MQINMAATNTRSFPTPNVSQKRRDISRNKITAGVEKTNETEITNSHFLLFLKMTLQIYNRFENKIVY